MEVQKLIEKISVETDTKLSNFQSKIVWIDDQQRAQEAFKDLSEPVSDYDEQGKKLEQKFSSLCAYSGHDGQNLLAKIQGLAEAEIVSF